ncbi:serine hydrolase domain-containing protein [Blastopirellula marina]|uniref:Serine hydrolase n=1 Tax=Blastopirellula marina TaxID=124 RepID=A0A2S8GNQ7_9BACT|nr:serine hydrolase domain-containing protein [Blastopirellula marina]PQO46083.1 serine hydrolase [Blastopirellula marina]
MQKLNFTAIGMLLVITVSCWGHAYGQDLPLADRGQAIQDYVANIHQKLGFSGVVLAMWEGEIVATVAVGPVDAGAGNDPLIKRSLFEIASCTKPFTAIAILQLAEQGKLSLDDPIDKHLPGVPKHSKAITIRHLLGHTSGIPGTNSEGAGDDFAKVLPKFLAGGPQGQPGRKFEYWNQGYSILSEVIARVSGMPYTDYIRKNIFEKSKMKNSCFTGDPPPGGASVAVGASSFGAARSALEHPYGSYGYQYRGMGGLVTNIEDLWYWDRALQSGRLLNKNSIRAMTTAGQGGYGLGWYVAADPAGKPSHRHSGSVRGFVAEIRRYPSVDGAIFVLSNQDDGLPLSLVSDGVEQLLFGQPVEVKLPQRPSPALADAAVGTYQDAKKRTLFIGKSNSLPPVSINWHGPVTAGYLGLDDEGKPQLYMRDYSSKVPGFKADAPLVFSKGEKEKDFVSLLISGNELKFSRRK